MTDTAILGDASHTGPGTATPAEMAAATDPNELLAKLEDLRHAVAQEGEATLARWQPRIKRESYLRSGLNLAHYLALRRRDLRDLQEALMPLGLSSLGRAESRVMANLDAVCASLARIAGRGDAPTYPTGARFGAGLQLLGRHAKEVFGPASGNRQVRIMVTLGTDAAEDYDFVKRLVAAGADIARINCAHDSPPVWRAMIANIRRAEAETGLRCKVAMDLCGPRARTGAIASVADRARLAPGDRLLLAYAPGPADGDAPFRAVCSLPAALDRVEIGQRVAIDEGACVARVAERRPDGAVLVVERSVGRGVKLKADKGLNFPDTSLDIPALTERDLVDLDTVAELADIIGYSFVQRPEDLRLLRQELAARTDKADETAIIAKIETALAVRNLPELIVEGAGTQPFAVMIARGDLAVEIGYQRLAEIQEELLWLCEAAHVPVVWATQVLDRFVKRGAPSRAEMTDAAMAERAECVMLNKGAYQVDAVSVLNEVLGRMSAHQTKKTSRLRALKSW